MREPTNRLNTKIWPTQMGHGPVIHRVKIAIMLAATARARRFTEFDGSRHQIRNFAPSRNTKVRRGKKLLSVAISQMLSPVAFRKAPMVNVRNGQNWERITGIDT